MNNQRLFTALTLVTCSFITACAPGSGEGLDSNGNPIDPGTQSIPLSADFVSIQANIFTPNCTLSGCHVGASAPLGLRLDDGASFATILDRDSVENPAFKLILAGDADNSYLVRKIEGIAGTRMPKDLPALSPDKIQAIRDWVNNGALGPSLRSIQQNILSPRCIACHSVSGGAPEGLNLDDGQAWSNLVGIQRLSSTEIRVVAGDSDSSFLIDKLEGNNLGGLRGDRMPLSATPLDQNTIDVIRLWIDQGAMDN